MRRTQSSLPIRPSDRLPVGSVAAVHLVFDRKYEVHKIGHKDGTLLQGQLFYVMVPEDQQASLTLAIGDGFHLKREDNE